MFTLNSDDAPRDRARYQWPIKWTDWEKTQFDKWWSNRKGQLDLTKEQTIMWRGFTLTWTPTPFDSNTSPIDSTITTTITTTTNDPDRFLLQGRPVPK